MSAYNFFDLERDGAIISQCQRYRYALHRRVSHLTEKACMFIMHNPSTADGRENDPTIRRCINYALGFECGHLFVANLFPLRATDPDDLKRSAGDIFGSWNREWVLAMADVVKNRAETPGPIICAWGPKGHYQQQDQTVLGWLGVRRYPLECLGRSADGSPRHPLMLRKTAKLQRYHP